MHNVVRKLTKYRLLSLHPYLLLSEIHTFNESFPLIFTKKYHINLTKTFMERQKEALKYDIYIFALSNYHHIDIVEFFFYT